MTASPSATVAAGASTTFTIRLTPSAAGLRSTTLRVAGNDADENPFDISILGGTLTPRQIYDNALAGAGWSGPFAEPRVISPYGDTRNRHKYAFNLSLNAPDARTMVPVSGTAGLPHVTIEGTGASRVIKVEYLRRKDSGLLHVAKTSPTMASGSFTTMTGTPAITSINSAWERVVIRDPATVARLFATVEVTLL